METVWVDSQRVLLAPEWQEEKDCSYDHSSMVVDFQLEDESELIWVPFEDVLSFSGSKNRADKTLRLLQHHRTPSSSSYCSAVAPSSAALLSSNKLGNCSSTTMTLQMAQEWMLMGFQGTTTMTTNFHSAPSSTACTFGNSPEVSCSSSSSLVSSAPAAAVASFCRSKPLVSRSAEQRLLQDKMHPILPLCENKKSMLMPRTSGGIRIRRGRFFIRDEGIVPNASVNKNSTSREYDSEEQNDNEGDNHVRTTNAHADKLLPSSFPSSKEEEEEAASTMFESTTKNATNLRNTSTGATASGSAGADAISVSSSSSVSLNCAKWKTAVDAKSGRTYYYHVETRQSQWRKPPELASQAERDEMERRERQQREFFAAMEANILKTIADGAFSSSGTTTTTSTSTSTSGVGAGNNNSNSKSPEEESKLTGAFRSESCPVPRPHLVRTISTMDEYLLRQLVQRVPSHRNVLSFSESTLGSISATSTMDEEDGIEIHKYGDEEKRSPNDVITQTIRSTTTTSTGRELGLTALRASTSTRLGPITEDDPILQQAETPLSVSSSSSSSSSSSDDGASSGRCHRSSSQAAVATSILKAASFKSEQSMDLNDLMLDDRSLSSRNSSSRNNDTTSSPTAHHPSSPSYFDDGFLGTSSLNSGALDFGLSEEEAGALAQLEAISFEMLHIKDEDDGEDLEGSGLLGNGDDDETVTSHMSLLSMTDNPIMQAVQEEQAIIDNAVVVGNQNGPDPLNAAAAAAASWSTLPKTTSLETVGESSSRPLLPRQGEEKDHMATSKKPLPIPRPVGFFNAKGLQGNGDGGNTASRPIQKPSMMMTRRNTCGTLYVSSTMSAPDKDATIKCVCGVFRAHILQSEMESRSAENSIGSSIIRSENEYTIFNDWEESRSQLHKENRSIPAIGSSAPPRSDGRRITRQRHLSRYKPSVPSLEEVTTFYCDVFQRAKMESDCIIMSLVYVERLIKTSGGSLRPSASNWRSILFSCMVLSSKVWDDMSMWNADFSQTCPAGVRFPLKRVNELEVAVLSALTYNVKVLASEYAKYYFLLRSMLIKSGLGGDDALTPLDVEGAKRLQHVSALYQTSASASKVEYSAMRSKSVGSMEVSRQSEFLDNQESTKAVLEHVVEM